MKTPIVTANGLTKTFRDFVAVDQIDFTVYHGECLGVLGPNGAGKTTTLRMLLGLSKPTAGELVALGYSLPRQARQMRAHIGVVPQQDNLDLDFTVLENLRTYARYFGLKGANLEQHLLSLLEFAELTSKANARVTSLSGGMKRRLTLARSLVNQPNLLILDEPTTGLDPQARQLIWQRLRQLKTQGTTLVLTTHYMEEAERLCDRILLLDHGRIITQGTPQELVKAYIEPHVIEIHGDGMEELYTNRAQFPHQRMEKMGETLFCYSHEGNHLLKTLQTQCDIEYRHRLANLEDVFLRLTGHELRD